MIELPNSFDLMTNMHHTNPQLVEINQLSQRNAELRGSNKLLKGIVIGLVLISIWAVYRIHDNKSRSKRN
jgi:hypothetical protein